MKFFHNALDYMGCDYDDRPFWLGVIISAISFLMIGVGFGFDKMSGLEVAAVSTSFITTMYVVFEKRIGFLWMILTTILYTILFMQSDLYASMAVNALFILPMAIYGWIYWGRDQTSDVATWAFKTNLSNKHMYFLILGTPLIFIGLSFVVTQLDGKLPILDSLILLMTVAAQILMSQKKLENWIIWAVMNVICIYVYFQQELYLVVFQYLFFLGNTVYGFYMWNKGSKN